jgi:hypothetical protein
MMIEYQVPHLRHFTVRLWEIGAEAKVGATV